MQYSRYQCAIILKILPTKSHRMDSLHLMNDSDQGTFDENLSILIQNLFFLDETIKNALPKRVNVERTDQYNEYDITPEMLRPNSC